MPDGQTTKFVDGLENVVAAETILSQVDGDAGTLILRGHYLQEIAGQPRRPPQRHTAASSTHRHP
jgi:citrate synthase